MHSFAGKEKNKFLKTCLHMDSLGSKGLETFDLRQSNYIFRRELTNIRMYILIAAQDIKINIGHR